MKIGNCLILVGLLLPATIAQADGWAFMSKHAQMKGFVIVEVGEAEQLRPPANTRWDVDLYQLNGKCFAIDGYYGMWGYGKKAAFLLANERSQIRLGLLEASIDSVKADIHFITLYESPSGTNVLPYSDNPEEILRHFEERQRELNRQLEQLRQGR